MHLHSPLLVHIYISNHWRVIGVHSFFHGLTFQKYLCISGRSKLIKAAQVPALASWCHVLNQNHPQHIMGMLFGKVWEMSSSTKPKILTLLGLNAAGKTTILYRLKSGDLVDTEPTMGFNVETIVYRHIKLTLWDFGGQDKIRKLWGLYFDRVQYVWADALIYVVDSSDRDRISEAKEELNKMLQEQALENAVLLVFANKQDMPNAMTPAEIMENLELQKLGHRKWFIQSTVALTGDGLYEGLDWLTRTLKTTSPWRHNDISSCATSLDPSQFSLRKEVRRAQELSLLLLQDYLKCTAIGNFGHAGRSLFRMQQVREAKKRAVLLCLLAYFDSISTNILSFFWGVKPCQILFCSLQDDSAPHTLMQHLWQMNENGGSRVGVTFVTFVNFLGF